MKPANTLKAISAAVAFVSLLAHGAHAQSPAEPLKVIFAGAVNNVPMMVAAENGYWRELGLDVSVQVLDSGSQIARALVSGAADIGAGAATSTVILSRAAGNSLTLVAPYHNNPMVVNGVQRVAVIARNEAGVTDKNPGDIVGKTVGVTAGSTGESYLRSYLSSIGKTLEDIKMVNLSPPDMSVALRQGTVDVAVPWEPYVSEIIRTQGNDVSVVSRGGPFGASVVGIMVTDDYLQKHRDIIEKYVLGAWKGVKFTREHPAEAAELAQRYIQGVDPQDAASAIEFMKSEFDPRISVCTEAAILQEQKAQIAAGNMKVAEPFPYDQIVQKAFIDDLLQKHPDLTSGLAPLPQSVEQCGGGTN
ncbi:MULTISPECIES: ABC transporter substrate-binding protein [Sinorhizobium]|uniref:Solute-binding protein family 3/N-terminal domain-containing protein n=1 Tax=Sinorhizobium americanum TaxID=194963 RepID=A0A2S3YUL5_9HYPH|nr:MULTISPECIES: ABC transporter substrate-binding protein [Sinorhizobium]PDT39398.1 hypothetical protein CO656_21310 [Sinorhizobium sp. FG01]POH35329.1 hypothetical protein ATY31_02335 [Sinorhizobium americanum]